jgi:hypothetical protein
MINEYFIQNLARPVVNVSKVTTYARDWLQALTVYLCRWSNDPSNVKITHLYFHFLLGTVPHRTTNNLHFVPISDMEYFGIESVSRADNAKIDVNIPTCIQKEDKVTFKYSHKQRMSPSFVLQGGRCHC